MKFTIPLQTEVAAYIKEKKGWPETFCKHYAEKFWNHYAASGWKLSSGNSMKDWKACFNSQWQNLKYKEDIEFFNKCSAPVVVSGKDFIPDDSEIGRLDQLMFRYSKPGGVDIPFEEFGKWYDFMKSNKLLLQMDQRRIDELLVMYNGDKQKCRCWCVRTTMEMYINSGMKFSDIINMRKRLNGSNTSGVITR